MIDAIKLVFDKDEAIGHSFNIGNPHGTITIEHLAEKIVRLAQSKSMIEFIDKDYKDVELRIPSIEKSKQILDFVPKVSLDEGLSITIDSYRNHSK